MHVGRALVAAIAETCAEIAAEKRFGRNFMPKVVKAQSEEMWKFLEPALTPSVIYEKAKDGLNQIWVEATRIGMPDGEETLHV